MAQCRLTERLEIQYLNKNVQDDEGFASELWKSYYKCWSNFKTVNGKEYIAAKATQSENVVTFTIRYCKKASELLNLNGTKNFRVIYKNQIYDIDYVSDYENKHDWIDIKAKSIS